MKHSTHALSSSLTNRLSNKVIDINRRKGFRDLCGGCFMFKYLLFCIFARNNSISNTMEAKEQVLKAMREFGQPVNAGKIAEITGIDRKEVDKAFAELKKEGAIVSPVRCKWEPA